MADADELTSAVAELDDSYLKVMLTLAIRRAQGEEPRRAGFWHALAVTLADEQERRQIPSQLKSRSASSTAALDDGADLRSVLREMQQEMATVEAELRESAGDLSVIDPEDVPPP